MLSAPVTNQSVFELQIIVLDSIEIILQLLSGLSHHVKQILQNFNKLEVPVEQLKKIYDDAREGADGTSEPNNYERNVSRQNKSPIFSCWSKRDIVLQ
jgi:hypothetical protein